MPTILNFLRALLRLDRASGITNSQAHTRTQAHGERTGDSRSHDTGSPFLLYFGRGIGGVPLDSRKNRR